MRQPKPKKTKHNPIADEVAKDIMSRKAQGIKTYGTPLTILNGRKALQDLYEELLDACCYLKQEMQERDYLFKTALVKLMETQHVSSKRTKAKRNR